MQDRTLLNIELEEFTNILIQYGAESEEVKAYIKEHNAGAAVFQRVIAIQKQLLSGKKLTLKENDLANAREMIKNRKK